MDIDTSNFHTDDAELAARLEHFANGGYSVSATFTKIEGLLDSVANYHEELADVIGDAKWIIQRLIDCLVNETALATDTADSNERLNIAVLKNTVAGVISQLDILDDRLTRLELNSEEHNS